MLIFGFGALLALQWFENSKPTLTGEATVVSRRLEVSKRPTHRQGYNYLITFRLSDGEEIELDASPEEYKQLTEGRAGTLTWQSSHFRGFTT